MKEIKFPIFKTKIESPARKFDLNSPKERKEYFELKAGQEIKKLRKYLEENTFIIYLLGKKNSGKGTYSKMFGEIVGEDRVDHFSIGDLVRDVEEDFRKKEKKKEIMEFLERNYRGPLSLERALSALEKRNTQTLLPTELILALVKREIARGERKALFIDGFPRDLDQISFALFFRDLIGYRDDPDIFVLIDVPEAVIDERIKWRRVCPLCQTSRNLKLLPTSQIGYDSKKTTTRPPPSHLRWAPFYLICDNLSCQGAKLLKKEGDELGIELIRERLKMDETLIEKAFSLYGLPKILLRNSLPVSKAQKFVDDYEITPEYHYQWDERTKKVKIKEKPWIIADDKGIQSYSLLAPPVVVSLIKQLVEILKLC